MNRRRFLQLLGMAPVVALQPPVKAANAAALPDYFRVPSEWHLVPGIPLSPPRFASHHFASRRNAPPRNTPQRLTEET